MDIKLIKENPKNPRSIKKDKFDKLVNSIKSFPEMLQIRPLVINQDNVVLGGNMRLKALKKAGITDVPVTIVDWDIDKQSEFIIKDNLSYGDWDTDAIANEWDLIELENWGFDLQASVDFDAINATEDIQDINYDLQTDIIQGDIFEIGEHRLMCGDATDSDAVNKLIGKDNIDLVFTDPMYNDSPLPIISIFEILKTKHFLIMATFKQCITFINSTNYNFRFDIVYNQKIPSSTMNKKVPYYLHKNIIYLTKDDSTIFNCDNAKGFFSDAGYYPSVIESAKNTSEAHGLTKNADGIKLILSGFKFNSVLDLFAGSGSTMIAAQQLKKKSYAMELEPKYCAVIIDRLLKYDSTLNVTKNGKPYNRA